MNRIYLILLSLLLVLSFQIPFVKRNLINFADTLKEQIFTIKQNIHEKLTYFSNQQKTIEHLELENKNLNYKLAKFYSMCEKCRDLENFKKISKPSLFFVEAVSYAALPDFSQIYVNYPKKISKPRGLVYNNMAAGIVVKNYGNYSLALLNSNPKTTYTVIIGKNEIPGIFYGKDNVVKYIKKYVPIKVGDIVKTSGLDGIFYKGALVGVVQQVTQKKLYQEVKLKLYYDKLTPDFFYVVEKNATIKQ